MSEREMKDDFKETTFSTYNKVDEQIISLTLL